MVSTHSLDLNITKTDPQQEKFVCETLRAHCRMYAIPHLRVYPQENCFTTLISKHCQYLTDKK